MDWEETKMLIYRSFQYIHERYHQRTVEKRREETVCLPWNILHFSVEY